MQLVSHVDPDRDWVKGIWPYSVVRLRWIAAIVGTPSVGGVISFARKSVQDGVTFFAIAAVLAAALWFLRFFVLRRFHADRQLQDMMFSLRAEIADVVDEETTFQYDQLHKSVADKVALFFRELMGDSHVNCAIRLAEPGDGKVVYRTKGRSTGMDPRRDSISEVLGEDEGIAEIVRSQVKNGAAIIPSIAEAHRLKGWKESPTDAFADVKSLIVAPINTVGGSGELDMLGLLYVTANREGRFNNCHALPLRAIADMLGTVYPLVMFQLRTIARQKDQASDEAGRSTGGRKRPEPGKPKTRRRP